MTDNKCNAFSYIRIILEIRIKLSTRASENKEIFEYRNSPNKIPRKTLKRLNNNFIIN